MRLIPGAVLVILLIFMIPHFSSREPSLTASAVQSTIYVPENYTRIQDAVEASSNGDTIRVGPRVYFENVVITKSLALFGAGRDSTVIDAGGLGRAITIMTTYNVTLSGFTLRNPNFQNSTIFVANSHNVTVSYDTVLDGQNGISIFNSTLVTAKNNVVSQSFFGIFLERSSNNLVLNNNSSRNSVNLDILDSWNNTVINNILSEGDGGLDLESRSYQNRIIGNQMVRNHDTGIFIESSRDNIIVENLVAYTHDPANSAAVGISLFNASMNSFYLNNLVANDRHFYANLAGDIATNTWDDGSRGNFWDDYMGLDDGSPDPRTGLSRIAGDGIGDTLIPHPCPLGGSPCSFPSAPRGVDWMPLTSPWAPPVLIALPRANPQNGYAPLAVDFTGVAAGGTPPYSFSWQLGDGTTSQAQNNTHVYTSPGAYRVSLRAVDAVGSTSTNNMTLTVLVPSGNLKVTVIDQNGNHIIGASLTSVSQPGGQASLSALTDAQGKAQFSELLTGAYVLEASATGFSTGRAEVSVETGKTIEVRITLQPSGATVLPLVIYGSSTVVIGIVAIWITKRRRANASTRPEVAKGPSKF